MKRVHQTIERAKVAMYCWGEQEWYILIAACALAAIFGVIATGHVCVCE